MKMVRLASRAELTRVYERLEWEKENLPSVAELVLWAHWVRLDPRLGEILVHFFLREFPRLHPTALREANLASPQPQALAVILGFCAEARASHDRSSLRAWADAVVHGVGLASPQLFFVGWPQAKVAESAMNESLSIYRRWGFYGQENLLGEKKSRPGTLLARRERDLILRRLLKESPRLTVKEYMLACANRVHKRTAERDLRECADLRSVGRTRGLTYVVKGKKKASLA